MLLVTIFAVPILIVAIILAALKIKNKPLKIIGIVLPSIIAVVLPFLCGKGYNFLSQNFLVRRH